MEKPLFVVRVIRSLKSTFEDLYVKTNEAHINFYFYMFAVNSCVLIQGDSTVGKTAINQVLCSDGLQFPKSYLMVSDISIL